MNSKVVALPNASSRNDIVRSLGENAPYGPLSPLRAHIYLTEITWHNPEHDVNHQQFWVKDRSFWWLTNKDNRENFDSHVGLEGHVVVQPSLELQQATIAAIEHIATVPWAFDILSEYSPTLAVVEAVDGNVKPITSCSLPDFPTLSFYSRIALKHIPPVSVAKIEHPILLAENLFHESVHQYINHQILTENILTDSYDSRSSPGIPISWRFNEDGSNQVWQVDRVLHAATVYTNILAWRREILNRFDGSSDEFVSVVQHSTQQAVASVVELYKALEKNLDQFTPKGAHRVGQLAVQTHDLIASLKADFDRSASLASLK